MLSQRRACRYVPLVAFIFAHRIISVVQENRITHVINVSLTGERVTFLDENDSEHFLRVPIHDSPTAQLSPYFECAYEFIGKCIDPSVTHYCLMEYSFRKSSIESWSCIHPLFRSVLY